MKITKHLLFAFCAVLLCGGCSDEQTSSPQVVPAPKLVPAKETCFGTYTGTLRGADCPGIEVTLRLKPGGAYEQHLKYIGRDAEFDEKGGYTVRENLLTLTPADGEQPEYYKVEENRLRRLDAEKQPVTGALADNYVLQKTTE